MHELTTGETNRGGIVYAAKVLTGWLGVVALAFMLYAISQAGSAGPVGVAVAAAICLLSGLISEGLAQLLSSKGSPLGGVLAAMGARLLPPLAVCLVLAAQGVGGRRHLAFICYLLTFYLVTLAVETWLALKRVDQHSDLNHGTR